MRYIIGFLLSIAVLIFIFVLIFRGGGEEAAPEAQKKLIDYANTSIVVELTTDGPVSADQTHRVIRTTVGRDESTLDYMQGYEGTVLQARTYANNQTSYASFLSALEIAGYTQGNKDKALGDERGYCPEGYRYIYEIKDGARSIQRFWSTSCGGAKTFNGKSDVVRNLFQRQIPDYGRLTRDF